MHLVMQGSINITSTYNSRTNDYEGSLVAKGDMWRVEASRGGSTSGNENSSLFLVQLGPVLLVRDTTLLLPVHLSKKHLLWYGYDRKVNQIHCWFFWVTVQVVFIIIRNVLLSKIVGILFRCWLYLLYLTLVFIQFTLGFHLSQAVLGRLCFSRV